MSAETLADALRVEVGIIVGRASAPITEEAVRNYRDFCAHGVEHYAARDLAVESAIHSFMSRADMARWCGRAEEADGFWRQAHELQRHWNNPESLAATLSTRRAGADAPPPSSCAGAGGSFPLIAKDGPTRGAPGSGG